MKKGLTLSLAVLLVVALFVFGSAEKGQATSVDKVPTANPTMTRGTRVSGNYTNVQTQDATYMRLREAASGGVQYLDSRWGTWQAFTEASRTKLVSITINLVGYQSDTTYGWYVQFYNYNAAAWDTAWYYLGVLPTSGEGTISVSVTNAAQAQTFVSAAGAFQMKLVDSNTATGGTDTTRTDLYIDLLQGQFHYDVTAPVSAITAPADMTETSAHSYVITGTSSDPTPDASGVTAVSVSTDGGTSWNAATPGSPGNYSTWSYNWAAIPAAGTYTISSRATDAAGNLETPSAGVHLIVDWTAPTVSSTNPVNGAMNVNVGTAVQAVFSEANHMNASTINASTFTLADELGASVTGVVSYNSASKTATFTPSADLFYGYSYTATLTTGIADQAGNHLAANYVWTFKTADILSMSLAGTYNRDGSPGGGAVNFGNMSPDNSPITVGGGTPAPYAIRLTVICSTNWNMNTRATQNLTDNTQIPALVLPISQLAWSVTGSGTWTPFSLTDAAIYSPARSRTPQPGGYDVRLDLRMTLSWNDQPGNYSTTTVFTVMQQP